MMDTGTAAAIGRQAAISYLDDAVESIDTQFGVGAARLKPELIAGFMIAASLAGSAAYFASRIPEGDHPLQGETLSGIEQALNSIAEALSTK